MKDIFRDRRVAAPLVAFTTALSLVACSQTKGPGSIETPAGSCIPSSQVFDVKPGDTLNVAVADISHDKKWSNRVYSEDYMGVLVLGDEEVEEIAFGDERERKGTEIKRIGENDKGLPYYQDWDSNRVDIGALNEDEPYGFAVREAEREVKIFVTKDEQGQVSIAFEQDCDRLPSVN